MKKYYVLLCLFFSTFLLAQVGINTTTPNAQLHIQSFNQAAPSNTDGLLIPKVDTFPVTNPTIDQQGMLVYLTTNVGSNPPGFYYWNNPTTSWIPIGNNNNNNWNLTGNLGADDTTNFIGTLDNTPLNFRVNNSNVGKFNSSLNNYAIGLNTLTQTNPGTQSIAIGTGAGRFQQTGTFGNIYMGHLAGENNATGLRNTFIGFSAARNNTSASNCTIIGFNAGASSNGSSNTFLGFASGFANTTSGLNTFIGASSGQSNTTGDINTYIGALSGSSNITGQNNTFLGHQSGVNNVSGNDNLFLGQLSGQNNTIGSANTAIGKSTRFLSNNLNNATAIGNLAAVGTSNALILGSINGVNGATSSVNVGIGTSTPLDRLHIVGNLRMVDGNQAAGRVLTSDVNGTATWQNTTVSAWGLNGNAVTNSAINFIGTTDNQDVVFRRNNLQSGLIGLTNTSFGSSSLSSNPTGTNNTAIGRFSLSSNTTGSFNTAIGGFALSNSSNGANNTAVGYQANLNNTFGQSNTSLGQLALLNTTSGGFNTAIGRQSLTNNITGSSNTVLGALSNVGTDNLVNATAIGARAQVDSSNSVVIGSISGINGGTGVNVGIGTTIPARRLHVSNGTSGGISSFGTGILLESNTSVYQHFLSPSSSESGLWFGSEVSSINGGINFNNFNQSMSFRTGGGLTRMTINNLGDVSIGAVLPGGQFELSLNEGRKPLSNFWTTTSDARLKNVNGFYEKGLSEIVQLKPIRYNYKNSDKRTFEQKVLNQEATGFLAQEVQQIFPEAVGLDRDGYLNFDIHPIMIASINAFKELNNKYEELKNKKEELEAKLNSLMNRIEALENK